MPSDKRTSQNRPGARPARAASTSIGNLRATAASMAEPMVSGVSSTIGAAVGSLPELTGARVRRVRRLGKSPLPSLPQLYPESSKARPIEVGLREIDIRAIRGTAVGGGDQRGGDFLPLKPFRSKNWSARWQRLRRALVDLVVLPPIDVVKYADGYWVIDGHNRVALALYTGQVAVDASVVELVPPGGQRTESIGSLEADVVGSRTMRARVDPAAAPPADPDRD